MDAYWTRPGLTQSLRRLASDQTGKHFLAMASGDLLSRIARQLQASDPYGEGTHLRAALARMGLTAANDIATVLEHQLWCVHREAAWACGTADTGLLAKSFTIQGAEWVTQTVGHPTILVAPMMLAMADASWILTQAIPKLAPGRQVILYGEEVETGQSGFPEIDSRIAGSGRAALQAILHSLSAGGVFCTYPDFVYDSHEALSVPFFGAPRPMSASFASIASRPGTMLLPVLTSRSRADGDGLLCRFFEPVFIADEGSTEDMEQRRFRRQRVAELVARMLEGLISEQPHQWRLLPTLSYDAPQMVGA